MKTEIAIGKTYSVRYPFFVTIFEGFDADGPFQQESWRPGCGSDRNDDNDRSWFSDGHGEMLLEVIAEFKPGRFPERVFFVRKWKDPDGKVFGLNKLRMTTHNNFVRMLKGYRRPYESEEA